MPDAPSLPELRSAPELRAAPELRPAAEVRPADGSSAAAAPAVVAPAVVEPSAGPELHYGLDIETDTTIDGLDPTTSPVVAAAVSTVHGDTVLTGPEAVILRDLDDLLRTLPTGVIVTWNGSSFDLPFLDHRARVLGVPLGLQVCTPDRLPVDTPWPPPTGGCRATWGAHGHLDGFRLYRSDVRRVVGLSCGLKAMARLVGLPVVEVDRAVIHDLSALELESYVSSDARLARQLVARRMPGAAAAVDRGPVPVAPGAAGGDPAVGRRTAAPRSGPFVVDG